MNNYLTVTITKHPKGWNVYKTFEHGNQSGGKKTLEWALYEAFEYGKCPLSKIVTINNKNYGFSEIMPMIKNDYIKQKIQQTIKL